MKIICKILAFGTIALSVGGCDLTMLPEHELSPEQYFQNESDLTLWSNQFYNDNLESADIGINDADDKIDNGLSDYITGSRNAASQTWSFSALRKPWDCSARAADTPPRCRRKRWPPSSSRLAAGLA